MVAVIWEVQLSRYPAFADVSPSAFGAFHERHVNSISWVVVPLMLAELVSAGWIALHPDSSVHPWLAWLGVALVVLVWSSTFFVQVPLHNKLASGFDADTVERLVSTNWVRTVGWSLRGVLVLAIAFFELR